MSLVAQLVKTLQCRRPGFHPWAAKIPWRRERPPTPVFRPGEFPGLYSPWGHKESGMTARLSFPLSLGHLFSFVASLYIFFGEMSIHILRQFFYLDCLLFVVIEL